MKIAMQDSKLKSVLEKRGEVFKKIGEINMQLVELDAERKKLGYKMDEYKERTKLIVDALGIEKNLQEFEFVAKIYIDEKDGETYYDVENMVEEYKEAVRAERKAKKS